MEKKLTNQNKEWWMRGDFYSLYIDKFAGNIQGLTSRLTYFTTLGIDCLHILPHYPSPMRDGGYDIIDHTGVRSELGTVDDFQELCKKAHTLSIKIMVDLVLNHVSSDHPWFIEARESRNNPKRDFFLWSETGSEYKDAPNVFPDFKNSNWIPNEQTDDYYYATFKPSQPDLNWNNPEVLSAMLGIVDELVAQGVDGFRLDAIMNLVERDHTTSVGIPETHERIRDVRAHLDMHHPGVILLGEVIGTTKYSRDYFGDGDECHLSYNFELMSEMLYALRCGNEHDRLQTVVEAASVLPPSASWMSFLRNHDSVSILLEETRKDELLNVLDSKREYIFSKGTQTVQRLYNLMDKNESLVRKAFDMLYVLPTATVMYYGDEIGMQNETMQKDEDDMRAVVRGVFDWEEAERQIANPDSLFHYARKCIKSRKNSQ